MNKIKKQNLVTLIIAFILFVTSTLFSFLFADDDLSNGNRELSYKETLYSYIRDAYDKNQIKEFKFYLDSLFDGPFKDFEIDDLNLSGSCSDINCSRNIPSCSTVEVLVYNNKPKFLRAFFESAREYNRYNNYYDINYRDDPYLTNPILITAIKKDYVEIFNLLIEYYPREIDFNDTDPRHGNTALMEAVQSDNNYYTNSLLNKHYSRIIIGLDPNKQNKAKNTALMIAAQTKELPEIQEILALFTENDLNVSKRIRNREGKLAYDILTGRFQNESESGAFDVIKPPKPGSPVISTEDLKLLENKATRSEK
ncbi:MAG: hypothetical protein ABIA04_08050 [Pseudomonadota bacterium]